MQYTLKVELSDAQTARLEKLHANYNDWAARNGCAPHTDLRETLDDLFRRGLAHMVDPLWQDFDDALATVYRGMACGGVGALPLSYAEEE